MPPRATSIYVRFASMSTKIEGGASFVAGCIFVCIQAQGIRGVFVVGYVRRVVGS